MSHRVSPLIAALLVWSAGSLPASASDTPESGSPPPTSSTLPETLVTASPGAGPSVNAAEFPGNATVITGEQIAASHARSLPDVLQRYEGVTVKDFSGFGLGADAAVNLRGVVNSSRSGALVLVNGVRQNGLTSDEIHWQSIPLDQVERVEIIRGGSGVIYGEGALSGVINIVLKQGGERPLEGEQLIELGSYGQRRFGTAVRGRSGPVTYGTSYRRSDVSGYRESTGSRATVVTTHAGWEPFPELRFSTDVLHSEDTTYFSGGITQLASEQRRRQSGALPGFNDSHDTQLSARLEADGPAGLSATVNAHGAWRESDIFTSFGDFATISPMAGLTLTGGHEAESDILRHTFVTGLDLFEEKAAVGLRTGKFDESNKFGYGLFAEETLRLYDRVSLNAGARLDKMRFQEDLSFPAFEGTLRFEGWSPKAGVSVDLVDGLTAFGSVSRPFKAPNVFDFSVAIPFGFVGNPTLQAQQGIEYETGLRGSREGWGSAEASWFMSRLDDEILFNPLTFASENFDTSRMGVELSVEPAVPVRGLHPRLSYTFLETEFRKGPFKENALPGVPEHQLDVALIYEPVDGLELSANWLLVHDFFRINDMSNQLPGDNYGVLSLGARYVWGSATLHFAVENATSEEYTSFQASSGVIVSTGENPAPPVVFRYGITVRF